MTNNLIEHDSYKTYLNTLVGSKAQRSGLRSELAKAMDCQLTYLSHVLKGNANLSLEQAEKLSRHLGHNKDESLYLLSLVLKERAGTMELKEIFSNQLNQIRENQQLVESRLGATKGLSEENKTTYYSSWQYAALHVAVSVPHLQTEAALAEHFGISLKRVREILKFLESAELIEKNKDKYQVTRTQMRLGKDNVHILKHHTNWRNKAISSLENEEITDLHYSGVLSLSKKDAHRIKDLILKNMKDCLQVVQDSSDEDVYNFNVDFFRLTSASGK